MKRISFTFLLMLTVNVSMLLFLTNCRNDIPPKNDPTVGVIAKVAPTNTKTPQPLVEVFVDDAILKKPFAIIGGTVHNISSGELRDLKINLELKRRSNGSAEIKVIDVVPSDLDPGESGRYSLQVLSDDWEASKLLLVSTSEVSDGLPFKAMQGIRRAPERPKPVIHLIETPRSKSKARGEEFINSPETPIPVP